MKQNASWLCPLLLALVLAACSTKTIGSPASGPPAVNGAPTAGSMAKQNYSTIPPEAVKLCKNSFSGPVTEGPASAPLRTLAAKVYETGEWDFDPNVMAIPHWESLEAGEVDTLLCISEDRKQKTTYPDGRLGYQITWDARLVQYPSGKVLKAGQFEGEQPPSNEEWESMKDYFTGPGYGDSPKGKLIEWVCPSFENLAIFCNGDPVFDIALSPDGNSLAIGGSNNRVTLWDVNTGKTLKVLTLSPDTVYVSPITYSVDGKYLAIPGAITDVHDPIRLWDIQTSEDLSPFTTEEYLNINSMAFSPDGKLLASGNWDGAIHVWDVAKRTVLRSLKNHTAEVSSLAFSPDGKLLASGGYDNAVIIWDVSTGEILQSLKSHSDYVNGVAFSPDGKKLASASNDHTVILWDVGTGHETLILKGEDNFTSVAFSPDGKTLASANVLDVTLWDANTGKVLQILTGHSRSVDKLVFTKDVKSLITGSVDSTVRKWDLTSGK
jgi:WD40 repeat protein